MPVVESFERLDYLQLLNEYLTEHGKPLKPYFTPIKVPFLFPWTLFVPGVVPLIPISTGTTVKPRTSNIFAKSATSPLGIVLII